MGNVIFHGDDLGLTKSFNRGIAQAFSAGVLRSTSIRTNGSAFEDAVAFAKGEKNLGVGVHLNLVEGRSRLASESVSQLCGSDGQFRHSFISLYRNQANGELMKQVEAEFRDQIDMVFKHSIAVDHLNSHQHSHAIPSLFSLVCRLAKEYGIEHVRLPRERLPLACVLSLALPVMWRVANLGKYLILNRLSRQNARIAVENGIKCNDSFIGISRTGHMTLSHVQTALKAQRGESTVEVLVHPCVDVGKEEYVAEYLDDYVHAPARSAELDAYLSDELKVQCERDGWRICSYKDL